MNIIQLNIRTFFLTILLLSSWSSFGQLKLEKVNFKSWFGSEANSKSESVYCLLGNGFLRTESAPNTDSLIQSWTTQHPSADIIPVFMHGPVFTAQPNSKLVYCWVVDGSDTLNVDLVRLGCIPGSTMLRPKTWDEMDDKQRQESYSNKKPAQEMFVEKDVFMTFISKVKKAEGEARRRKIGIWVDK